MTGPRTPLVHPNRLRGRLLLPFLLIIGLSPLACTGDQPTEVVIPNTALTMFGKHHPFLMVAAGTSAAAPKASVSFAMFGSAIGPKVLILADADGASTNALAATVAAAGFQVTTRPAPENTWDGTTPALTGFAAVIHLDGATWNAALPVAAQTALTDFVQNGGGFVGAQWNGYEATTGQTAMPNLVLQTYASNTGAGECYNCLVTYSTVAGQEGHPVLRGIPSPFTFAADGNDAGPVVSFATDPSTVLMQIPTGAAAVLVRQFGRGKVVNFSFSPNYGFGGNGKTLLDPNVQQLYLNALYWTTGWSPVQPQTITFAALADKTFGDPAFAVAATASSGLPVTFTVAGSCSMSETTVTLTGAGTCAVTAHQAGSAGFHPADDVTQSFTIKQAVPTIQWSPSSLSFGGVLGAGQLNATATGVNGSLNGSFTYNPPAGTRLTAATPVTVQFSPSDANYTGATKTVEIAVEFDFSGFFLPVRNAPVINLAKAGQTIALKFSLGGYQGAGILASGSPSSSSAACPAGASVARVDNEDETGNSGLHASGGSYTYYWNTEPTWAGTCRMFVLSLADGTSHEALFSFGGKPVAPTAVLRRIVGRGNDGNRNR